MVALEMNLGKLEDVVWWVGSTGASNGRLAWNYWDLVVEGGVRVIMEWLERWKFGHG